MKIDNQDYRTVWLENDIVKMINQPLLPHKFEIVDLKDINEVCNAIKTMTVRGAPAIGATAAFGLAQAALHFHGDDFKLYKDYIKNSADILSKTRPTAYDLFFALNKVQQLDETKTVEENKQQLVKAAQDYADWNANLCKQIGIHGAELIKDGDNILTHCNAGALACVDYGTALAPMRIAHQQNKKIHVFVDETRPRCQGSRLTAWELSQEGIPHSIIVDNAAGHYMKSGNINLVITGADRIAANGDAANKIGTYEKAVLAKENNIPFYIAAPISTIDFDCKSGNDIPIEERDQEEVTCMFGLHNDKITKIRIAPEESKAKNPAFDVTPAKYITGIITEKGVLKPTELKSL